MKDLYEVLRRILRACARRSKRSTLLFPLFADDRDQPRNPAEDPRLRPVTETSGNWSPTTDNLTLPSRN
jgi:hypothetical protein